MSEDTHKEKDTEIERNPVVTSEQQKSMTILMEKVMGDTSFTPTETQVDEILSQKSKVIDYIHEDKKLESSDNRFYFLAVIIFSGIIILSVLFFAKENLTQIVSLIIGGLGGYGIGKNQSTK